MGADNFTGIVKFNCIKKHKYITKYTIIQSQSPNNYKSLDHFKKIYDLNTLTWYKTHLKAKEMADKNEEIYTTHHGIIYIDYTHLEPIEMKLMYSNELKQLTTTQNVISGVFNYSLYVIYIIFMLKLLSNLYY
jgi:hypothetical protein